MALRIVLLGGPGAGKGTQAMRLCDAHGLAHVATGDIFREHVASATDLGRQICDAMEQGRLVSDELASAVVYERLTRPDCERGYVLDGFPRSLPQAREFSNWLASRGESLDAALELDVSDEEIVRRIQARRQCPVCGAVYNLRFDAPSNGTRCTRPGCRGELILRADDKEATVRERLRIYHETTRPIMDFYEDQGLLRRVHGGDLPPDDVYKKIEDVLADMGVAGTP